jgi:hypothetical protein
MTVKANMPTLYKRLKKLRQRHLGSGLARLKHQAIYSLGGAGGVA